MTSSREKRFVGHGNFTQGDESRRLKAWRIICRDCYAFKTVSMPNGALPPDAVLRIFQQSGWYVGKYADDDICPECIGKRKTKKENERRVCEPGVPANPHVAFERERAFVAVLHGYLIDGRVQDAISAIETRLIGWPLRRQRTETQPKMEAPKDTEKETDEQYSAWLASLETKRGSAA